MKDCPRCKSPVDGAICPSCGYGGQQEKTKGDGGDPDWWRCCDVDSRGDRCSKPGSMTEGTHGSDRWYCYQHYPPFRARGYARTAPEHGFAALRNPFQRVAGDIEAQAERAAIQDEGNA